MSKKGSIGYQAEKLREKGNRRIARLEQMLSSQNVSQSMEHWARSQIKEIKSAIQGTRQYSKSGKRYRSKSQNYIRAQISRLENAVKQVEPRFTISGSSIAVVQRELNKASVGASSVYTKEETKIFYHATQKAWHREGVGEHDRNEAILTYYNDIRIENGLSPLSFNQIVDYILQANKEFADLSKTPWDEMTDEQQEYYEEYSPDVEDDDTSPVSSLAAQGIRNALDIMFSVNENLSDILGDFEGLSDNPVAMSFFD